MLKDTETNLLSFMAEEPEILYFEQQMPWQPKNSYITGVWETLAASILRVEEGRLRK
jgi:hypothetical protein